jgi:hypothetical protein
LSLLESLLVVNEANRLPKPILVRVMYTLHEGMQYTLDIVGESLHNKNQAISRGEKKGILARPEFLRTHSLECERSVRESLDGFTLRSRVKVIIQLDVIDRLIQLGQAAERLAPDWHCRNKNNSHLGEKR